MSWADTTAGVMKMRNGANSAWISLYELDGTFLASDISLAAGSAAAPSLFFTGDTNTGLFSPGADTVALATAGSNRLHISSGGLVGIGTTVLPGNKLTVGTGNTGADSSIVKFNTANANVAALGLSNWDGTATIYGPRIGFDNSARGSFAIGGSDASNNFDICRTWGTPDLRIDSSGRLLVGTSSGNYDFQVGATGSSGVAIDKAQNLVHGTFGTGGSLKLRAQLNATAGGGEILLGGSTRGDSDINAIVLRTSDVERIRVTSTGKTSLSSTDNSYGQLQIGNTTSEGEVGIAFIPGVTAFGTTPTSTNGDSRIWVMGPNVFGVGATQFAIGNKGVGNYVAKLASNTATSWTFSSDERLKNIEGPVVAATQIIEAINPVYYSFKADSAATRKVGLIAQNVLSVLPEVVDVPEEEQDAEGKQQYMGLAMTDLVPVLIAALKESNLRIKELTDRVAALEGA